MNASYGLIVCVWACVCVHTCAGIPLLRSNLGSVTTLRKQRMCRCCNNSILSFWFFCVIKLTVWQSDLSNLKMSAFSKRLRCFSRNMVKFPGLISTLIFAVGFTSPGTPSAQFVVELGCVTWGGGPCQPSGQARLSARASLRSGSLLLPVFSCVCRCSSSTRSGHSIKGGRCPLEAQDEIYTLQAEQTVNTLQTQIFRQAFQTLYEGKK